MSKFRDELKQAINEYAEATALVALDVEAFEYKKIEAQQKLDSLIARCVDVKALEECSSWHGHHKHLGYISPQYWIEKAQEDAE